MKNYTVTLASLEHFLDELYYRQPNVDSIVRVNFNHDSHAYSDVYTLKAQYLRLANGVLGMVELNYQVGWASNGYPSFGARDVKDIDEAAERRATFRNECIEKYEMAKKQIRDIAVGIDCVVREGYITLGGE